MRKQIRQLIRSMSEEGWRAALTKGGHWKFTHPLAAYPVFAGSTPSDQRSLNNLRGELRRALRVPMLAAA